MPSLAPNRDRAPIRIGAIIGPHDPYWVLVREAVYQRIEQLGASLIPLEFSESTEAMYKIDPGSMAEELLAHKLDAIVSQTLPLGTIYQIVYNKIPIIYLGETQMRHPLFCSPEGLYQVGQMAAEVIAKRLGGRGRVLCVGGLLDMGEDKGVSRISGFCDALRQFPEISVLHCPTAWRYDQAYPPVYSALRELGPPIDAIFGISDSLALAGRDAGRALGVITPETVIVGINGDPLAMAAIADGSFYATIETDAGEMGAAAVDLAFQAAKGVPLPDNYSYPTRVITAENVSQHAVRKLTMLARLPTSLVGVNRQQERHRLVQLETSAAINQRVGLILDRRQLSREIANLIRVNFGFDDVQFLLWSETTRSLFPDGDDPRAAQGALPLEEAGLLAEVIRRQEAIFIPDTRYSRRFAQDKRWPETRARVVLPVRLGGKILGLLDLHSRQPILTLRFELIGLQSLADQFGIALRNAELYSEALSARETAERANQLKTRLLANVSHELRTPLNVILGYSQSALSIPQLYGMELPENLRQDLRYIYQSGEHLIRIINDLLDLSRAEVGELNVFPEAVDTHHFLCEVFDSMAHQRPRSTQLASQPAVTWELSLPPRLPVIQADPVRLRQILLNLLSNAQKFTTAGKIILGAEVEPPNLHIWVSDTGPGISPEQQERIFDPFVTSSSPAQEPSAAQKGGSVVKREGIGLGLSITRRLVALHGGTMSLESQTAQGSAFHVYLPLPNLSGNPALPPEFGARPALLLVTAQPRPDHLPEEIGRIASRRGLEVCFLSPGADLSQTLRDVHPVVIAWDMASASAAEWNLLNRLHTHPQLVTLPLVIFAQEDGSSSSAFSGGVTNVMTKPFGGKKLVELIESLAPAQPEGQGGAAPLVLVVDDDPRARALYQRLAVEAIPGAQVRAAEDGAQALAILEQEIPNLVILDLMMPHVDGFQVLERMRSNPRTSRVPVIILSGKQLTFDDVQRLNFAGVTWHTKGLLEVSELVEALRSRVSPQARLSQPTSLLVKQALAYLQQNYANPITRAELAESVGVSENYLTQIFRQELGISPLECLNRLRIQKARELLTTTGEPVTAIANSVGFDDPAYFSRVFRKHTGCSPQVYRQNS